MKRLAALLALGLLGAADAPKKAPACELETARPATIEQIADGYESFAGDCVKLTGIAWGAYLFSGREALLESVGGYGEGARHSIVLLPDRREDLLKAPQWAQVVGRVGSCSAQNAAVSDYQNQHPDQIVMVAGYCHTSLETYLDNFRIELLDRPVPLRLTESEVSAENRLIVEAPENAPNLASYRDAAFKFITALRRNDKITFRNLAAPDLALEKTDPERGEAWYKRRAGEMDARFAQSRAALPKLSRASLRAPKTFVRSDELAEWRKDKVVPGHYITCWCRSADCQGKWPVAPQDADNMPQRPYYCVATNDFEVFRKGSRLQAQSPLNQSGFAEPDWTAAKRD